MRAFVRSIIGSIVLVLPLAGALPALAQAQMAAQPAASSFQHTCRNIRVDGIRLFAECRRANGVYNNASIEIRGIANSNGNLVIGSLVQASSYQQSCRRIKITGAVLHAACSRPDGSYHQSSIMIPGLSNNNGTLQY